MKDFSAADYLAQFPQELLMNQQTRKHLCSTDPLLFSLLYLKHHISFESKPVELSQFHLDMFDYMRQVAGLDQGPLRNVFIAPRSMGKTTLTCLVLPLWVAAFEYHKFLMMFSSSEAQAIQHLQTFRRELETNELLRADFPELCQPLRSKSNNRPLNQSAVMCTQSNDVTFVAKGIESATLGAKMGHRRPSLLILDELEDQESNYSEQQAQQRLQTVLNSILPMSIKAQVVLIGTTTRQDSIIDMCRQTYEQYEQYLLRSNNNNNLSDNISAGSAGASNGELYVRDTEQLNSKALEHAGVANDPSNQSEAVRNYLLPEQSASDSTVSDESTQNIAIKSDELKSGESTHQNYLNQISSQMLDDIEFYDQLEPRLQWVLDHKFAVHYFSPIINRDGIEYSAWPALWSMQYLNSIRHTRSFYMNYLNRPVNLEAGYWDDSDIVIETPDTPFERVLLSIDPAVTTKQKSDFTAFAVVGTIGNQIYVIHSEQIKGSSADIRQKTDELVKQYGVQLVYLEINMGNDLWRSVFDGLQCKIRYYRTTERKELRISRALDQYKRNKVRHCKTMTQTEAQMFSYPKVTHDDLVDAVSAAINYFTALEHKPTVRVTSYI